MKPRGVLPTIVTDDRVVLCKISPVIRDAYEMRLCLYMAKTSGRSFVLQVPERARVEPALLLRIETHGGLVAEAAVSEYTVYFGALDAEGAEHDGWVLGDSSALEQLRGNLKSDQLKHALAPGAEWCVRNLWPSGGFSSMNGSPCRTSTTKMYRGRCWPVRVRREERRDGVCAMRRANKGLHQTMARRHHGCTLAGEAQRWTDQGVRIGKRDPVSGSSTRRGSGCRLGPSLVSLGVLGKRGSAGSGALHVVVQRSQCRAGLCGACVRGCPFLSRRHTGWCRGSTSRASRGGRSSLVSSRVSVPPSSGLSWA